MQAVQPLKQRRAGDFGHGEKRKALGIRIIAQRRRGEQLVMNWAKVPGSSGFCKVGVRDWVSDRTGEKMQSNEIKRFLEPDQNAAPAAPAAAPAWAPGQF